MKWLPSLSAPARMACLAVILSLSGTREGAAVLFWDSNGTASDGITNGGGSWIDGGLNWYDGANEVPWNNANNDVATFGSGTGTGSTVTLGSSIRVGGITTTTNGATITGTASFGVTLAPGAVITLGTTSTIAASLSGNTDLIKTGGGTLVLNNFASTYTGNTLIKQSGVQIRLANYLPASTTVILGTASTSTAASLALSVNQTVAGLSALGSSPSNNIITHSNLNTNTQTLTVNPDGAASPADSTFAGVIKDGNSPSLIALTKAGSHALTLTGANTYTGPTLVTGGTLRINGSLASALTVNAGTLEGTGNGSTTGVTSAAVTIGDNAGNDDAILSPGNSVGTFTTTSTLSFASDAVFKFELDSTAATADKMVANGVTIDSGAAFSFIDLNAGGAITSGTVFTIIDNTSGSAIGGMFGNLANNATFTVNNYQYTASYFGGAGSNDLTLTATLIPEPDSFGLALGGLGLLLCTRSRGRSAQLS